MHPLATDPSEVLGLVLGGGKGTRLFPLTEKRAKPAVPIAGKFRLIDIPISNCIHSGITKIAILTQFQSTSLHRHISRTYRRDMFTRGWVEILAADQSLSHTSWYQGTADAVRQKWLEIEHARTKYVLILAGDHIYNMDYRRFLGFHIESGADLSLAVQPVSAADAPDFGILKRDEAGRIVHFAEKPASDALGGLESLPGTDRPYLGSMGIYVVSTALLGELLQSPGDDFGGHIVPRALQERNVMGYVYDGYWADIGTIRRFYEVNLELARPGPGFDLFDPARPIFTRPRFLPPSIVDRSTLDDVLVADGCRIFEAEIIDSVIGLRSIVSPGATIRHSIVMGADDYEMPHAVDANALLGRPPIGIGRDSTIEGAIIDKNARIGSHVHIRRIPERPDGEGDGWISRDGIVVVPKGAAIRDGTVV